MIAVSSQIPWKFRASVYPLFRSMFKDFLSSFPLCILKGSRTVHTSVDEFFNRKQELESVYTLLKSDPRFSVIMGPVNSGKSLLLTKVLQDLKQKDKTPILDINLREISFDSVDSLVTTLDAKLGSWMKDFAVAARHHKISVGAYGISFDWKLTSEVLKPITKLNRVFNKISAKLPPQTFWGRHQRPIFVIDEANELQALTADLDGHTALINLFKWLTLHTKELHRFHTLLISSDSFFHIWVASYIGASRYASYVLGDLTNEEAENFWNQRLVPHAKKPVLPDFECVYGVCGGNMHLLKLMFWEQHITNGKIHPRRFFMVAQEKAKLSKALLTDKMPWNQDQLLSFFKEMVEAKERFLEYNAVCRTYGKLLIDSLIKSNLIHLRPTKCFSYDLTSQMDGVPVVTPETPCGFIAMEELLTEFKK